VRQDALPEDVQALLAELLAPRGYRDFDPACTRIDKAVAAIWLLYRRAKWALLDDLGLRRHVVEPIFGAYDMRYISTDHGRIHTEKQAAHLIGMYPQVEIAALDLISRYLRLTQDGRAEYYLRRARAQAMLLTDAMGKKPVIIEFPHAKEIPE